MIYDIQGLWFLSSPGRSLGFFLKLRYVSEPQVVPVIDIFWLWFGGSRYRYRSARVIWNWYTWPTILISWIWSHLFVSPKVGISTKVIARFESQTKWDCTSLSLNSKQLQNWTPGLQNQLESMEVLQSITFIRGTKMRRDLNIIFCVCDGAGNTGKQGKKGRWSRHSGQDS